jgi:hypothetical protein
LPNKEIKKTFTGNCHNTGIDQVKT